MRIEQLKVENFRVFEKTEIRDLTGLTVVVGANGSGKSTLFDIFGFLRDALKDNVRAALGKRGGFREVISRGKSGPIRFEIKFREKNGPLATYTLEIGEDEGRPVVEHELLKYRRGQHGRPWHFF